MFSSGIFYASSRARGAGWRAERLGGFPRPGPALPTPLCSLPTRRTGERGELATHTRGADDRALFFVDADRP
jgi:hypothetical protein